MKRLNNKTLVAGLMVYAMVVAVVLGYSMGGGISRQFWCGGS